MKKISRYHPTANFFTFFVESSSQAAEHETNTLPSLKLLQQGVHELVRWGGGGGGGFPLNPPLDNVVGSKRLRSGRVK